MNSWFHFDQTLAQYVKEAEIDFESTHELKLELAMICYHWHRRFARAGKARKLECLIHYKQIVGSQLGTLTRYQYQMWVNCKPDSAPAPRTL